jgi:hypothetical protein
MGNPLFTNNAGSTFANPVDMAATTVTLVGGGGALFPQPTGGDYFMVTFITVNGTQLEICKCTARAGDTLTVVRAQEGTGAQNFQVGDQCQLRITASTMNYLVGGGSDNVKNITAGTGISATGTGTVTIANTGVTGITAGSNITVSGSTGNVTVNATVPSSVSSLVTTNFSILESGGKLVFKYGTTTIASLDSSGNFTALGNITGLTAVGTSSPTP